jgi:hypothetical protein
VKLIMGYAVILDYFLNSQMTDRYPNLLSHGYRASASALPVLLLWLQPLLDSRVKCNMRTALAVHESLFFRLVSSKFLIILLLHISFELLLSAGMPPIRTVDEPGIQWAVITWMQDVGVSTPLPLFGFRHCRICRGSYHGQKARY